MKNPVSIKKILMILILLMGISLNSVAMAAQPQIVLFCSSWNLKCRDARKACSNAAQDLGLKFVDLDIDKASSQQKANELGVNIPNSIPYIYVFDNKGRLVKEKLYRGESAQSLRQELSQLRL